MEKELYTLVHQSPNKFVFEQAKGQKSWQVQVLLLSNGKELLINMIVKIGNSPAVKKTLSLQLVSKYHVGLFLTDYTKYDHIKQFAFQSADKSASWVVWQNKAEKYIEGYMYAQMVEDLKPIPFWQLIRQTGFHELLLQKVS